MPRLTLEEFAAKCIWEEHMRLMPMFGEYQQRKMLKHVLLRMRRNDLGLERNGRPTEWGGMVRAWYEHYIGQL